MFVFHHLTVVLKMLFFYSFTVFFCSKNTEMYYLTSYSWREAFCKNTEYKAETGNYTFAVIIVSVSLVPLPIRVY